MKKYKNIFIQYYSMNLKAIPFFIISIFQKDNRPLQYIKPEKKTSKPIPDMICILFL
jgi:hypothetical protein